MQEVGEAVENQVIMEVMEVKEEEVKEDGATRRSTTRGRDAKEDGIPRLVGRKEARMEFR